MEFFHPVHGRYCDVTALAQSINQSRSFARAPITRPLHKLRAQFTTVLEWGTFADAFVCPSGTKTA